MLDSQATVHVGEESAKSRTRPHQFWADCPKFVGPFLFVVPTHPIRVAVDVRNLARLSPPLATPTLTSSSSVAGPDLRILEELFRLMVEPCRDRAVKR